MFQLFYKLIDSMFHKMKRAKQLHLGITLNYSMLGEKLKD